tara:strand:+ start:659 stop:1078 length:420 start_codon:yes stop_codon:yes gene_type:complete
MVILVYLIVYLPIYNSIAWDYPFYFSSFIFVLFTGITTQLLFFDNYFPVIKNLYVKVGVVFLTPFVLLFLVDIYFEFILFGDNVGYQSLANELLPLEQIRLMKYIKYLTLFFAISSIIGALLIPIKMIRLIYRQLNQIR